MVVLYGQNIAGNLSKYRAEEAEREAQRQAAEKASRIDIGQAITGAALAYLTGGLATGAATALGAGTSVAGGIGAAMAPTASNVMTAVAGGLKAAKSKDLGEAAMTGIETGVAPVIKKVEEDTARAAIEAINKRLNKEQEDRGFIKSKTKIEKGEATHEWTNPLAAAESKMLTYNEVAEKKRTGDFRIALPTDPKLAVGYSLLNTPMGLRYWKAKPEKPDFQEARFNFQKEKWEESKKEKEPNWNYEIRKVTDDLSTSVPEEVKVWIKEKFNEGVDPKTIGEILRKKGFIK